jgi:hypothetical protein
MDQQLSSPACASAYECYGCGLGLGLTVAVASTAHGLIKLGYRAEAQSVRKACVTPTGFIVRRPPTELLRVIDT